MNHFTHATNLRNQLLAALAETHTGRHARRAQLCTALAAAEMLLQSYPDPARLSSLEDECGQPEVVDAFGHRNPATNFVWAEDLAHM